MRQVTIIGAGIAGLAAALRLVERGYKVTLFEQNDFLGGKLGAHNHGPYKADYHEHSFHMYLNWYHNFWRIADEIGVRDQFVAQPEMMYLKRDRFDKNGSAPRLTNVGAIGSFWHNIFSGVESPADMLVYGYSLVDLLGSSVGPPGHLAKTSVFARLASRRYMTEGALGLHEQTLAKAFASPTYLNAALSYRRFISYGYRQPEPMMWLLKGNTQQYLFEPFQQHLAKLGVRIHMLHRADHIDVENGKIVGLKISRLEKSPTTDPAGEKDGKRFVTDSFDWPVTGEVILAVPIEALSQLVNMKMFFAAPELGNVRKLPTQPMPSLDVYFKRKLSNIPAGITLLLDSPYHLTFIDNSQLWRDGGPPNVTFLNLVMSDFSVFEQYTSSQDIELIKEYLFEELRHYIEFDYRWGDPNDDIDRDRCHLQTNVSEELFTNQVGTWEFRPGPTCAIPNLFIAGDHCKTCVDVVTIEGAVVSGLMAAEAIRQRAAIGEPIEIIEPETYPQAAMAAIKLMGAPYAYAAKIWSMMSGGFQSSYKEVFPNG